LQLALGITSLALAIGGVSIAWIPDIGAFGWVLCALGLVLGVTALIVGLTREAGAVLPAIWWGVSLPALGVTLYVAMAPASTPAPQVALNRPGIGLPKNIEMPKGGFPKDFGFPKDAFPKDVGFPKDFGKAPLPGPPTAPTGALTLVGGKAEMAAELTAQDPFDRMRGGSRCKVYTIEMKQGRTYEIDHIAAPNYDAYLRLEDPEGKHLAHDDDSGGNLNSRLTYNCPRSGRYRIIATTFGGGATGRFTLRVQER
jgi:hypothetical protein